MAVNGLGLDASMGLATSINEPLIALFCATSEGAREVCGRVGVMPVPSRLVHVGEIQHMQVLGR